MEKYRRLLIIYFAPLWKRATLLGLILFSGVILRLVNPQILKNFIDAAIARTTFQTLAGQAGWYLTIALVVQVIAVLEHWLATDLGLLATNRLRADLALHCLKLDLSFHKQHTPGEMIERIDSDVSAMSNFFSRFVIEILGSSLLMMGVLVMMFRIDWRVGIVFSLFCILTLFLMYRLKDVAVPHYRKARQADAELFGFLEERLSGTEDVRANGATQYILRRFYEHSRPVLYGWVKASAVSASAFGTTWILFAIGTAISLALGAYLYQQGLVTIGTVYLIFRYAELLNQPLETLIRQFEDLQSAGASAVRILDLISVRRTIRDEGRVTLPTHQALAVQFEEVSFAYQDTNPLNKNGTQADNKLQGDEAQPNMLDNVLEHISFELPANTILGVLGRTGSGKTTLTRLLARLYEPQQGHVRLGGVPLPDLPLAALRQHVNLVTQDIHLFNASLRDNLTLFDPSIPDARILAAFEQLELLEWFNGLPDGLETKLEPGGSRLSAGEAQLLAFVRVFLRDPGLIILDEASSRLDPATEARLERAIGRLLQNRTAIIIAHRLGTVQRADRILILENGCQVEYGERLFLASDPASRFASLLRTGMAEALV